MPSSPSPARAWIERLLVTLGPTAEVIDRSDGLPADLRADATRRILNRYQPQ